ncbi:sensor histidine kinase [Pararobbsia silviterrae]|uniref:histidine kinase n=1 Tax=Pararobbsia silviterrae TaxID=1792498 RepID=A0A494Y6P0_9BURK|nr:HAMP domain-containing sensor histidine kinase [Pararobbsia silviterrae]RKP55986.1 sensor histidine kinase [Pararobbsia silviterrae]
MKASGPALISPWRTTILRVLLAYAAFFALSVLVLFGVNYWQSATYTATQADFTIGWQFRYFQALPHDALRDRILARIHADAHRPVNYYGLFDSHGRWLLGDVLELPASLTIDGEGEWIQPVLDSHTVRPSPRTRMMAEHLPDGSTIVIARDVDEMIRLRDFMLGGLIWGGLAMVLAGGTFGLVYGRRQLRRIREVQRVALRIAQGHLDERLPAARRDELDLLTHIINHMLDEVVRLMAEVKGACDGIAHDLRTPLIHVRTLLGRAIGRIDEGEGRALVEQALAASDDVLARFGAMLRISEIESMGRRGGFKQVDLGALVDRIHQLYAPMGEFKNVGVTIETDPDLSVEADYPLLFEALSNLVDNAIKFTPACGSVRIALTRTANGPRIAVSDTGPGIDPSERHAVVQRFYRSARTRDIPGSGLGLSVVLAVAHLHDFGFEIVDTLNGTTIHLDCWPQSIA